VGLLFFNEAPDRFFPYARIEVVDKPDPTGIGITEKIFTGPLDKQLSDSHAYIRNYIIKEYVTKVQDTLYAPNRYVELSLEDIIEIQSKGTSKFAKE
jgi:ATP-dependent DNA helicase RecG